MKYCIDTSAILDGWTRYYPPDSFPTFWKKIDQLADDGGIIAPEEVLHELERKDDDVFKWAKERKKIFFPLDTPVQVAAQEILAQFPKLVDSRPNRSPADPFVIALAQVSDSVVLTGEKNSGTDNRPRIPNVCDHFGVRWIGILQLIREQGWKF